MEKLKTKIYQFFTIDPGFMKKYLRSLLPYILISGLFFLAGIIAGYYFVKLFPSDSEKLLSFFKQTYEPILGMSKISQILFIFLKNGFTSLLMIISGILFGIIPLASLISNGEMLGMIFGSNIQEYSIFYLLSGILPHGIIEIPCFLLTSAIGLKIGRVFYKKIFKKGGNLKEEFNLGLTFFLKIIIIFLFLAAVLEVLVSSELLRIY